MGKRSRVKARAGQAQHPADAGTGAEQPGAVGPRQPCPCGSGRRYKACHGSGRGPAARIVSRPFEGLASECDWVALRELVPAATAPLTLRDSGSADRTVVLCSLLPMAAPALVREDGTVWLGLQVQHSFGDPGRELAAVLLEAFEAEPGAMVGLTEAPGEGPRLQDLLVDVPLRVTVHDGFDFWVADVDDPTGAVHASLEQANAAASPDRSPDVGRGAYWTNVGAKEHLRWVLPHDEDALLDALARLHVAEQDRLVDGGRLVGMFRAHGLLVPVWDLPVGTGPEALEDAGGSARGGTRRRPGAGGRAAVGRRAVGPLGAREPAGDTPLRFLTPKGEAKHSAAGTAKLCGPDPSHIVQLPDRCCIPRQQRSGFSFLSDPKGRSGVYSGRCSSGTQRSRPGA